MRRNYISTEYINIPTSGTFNMSEEANYFGSKMLEIEDLINVENQNLIYYQRSSGEQLDFSSESTLETTTYSASSSKLSNHKIYLDESQSMSQKENNTSWIIEIDLTTCLNDYIFAALKRYRTFEGLRTNMTRLNDVNSSIREYIDLNVINRYKFQKVDLFIQFKDLRNQNVLRYKNNWNSNSGKDEYKNNKFQAEVAFDNSSVKLRFSQEKKSKDYNFDYFFNILYEKI